MRAAPTHLLHLSRSRWLVAALVGATLALGGCASGPRTITSQVQSYASMQQVRLPTTYRMEILPSQEQQTSFSQIEYAAQEALQRVGLKRAAQPEQARLVVQVGASASQGRAYHPELRPVLLRRPTLWLGAGLWRWLARQLGHALDDGYTAHGLSARRQAGAARCPEPAHRV